MKGNILLETEAGQCLRLSVVTDGGSKKRFSIHLETASSLRAARVRKVLILCSEPDKGVQRFMDNDQAFRVHDMLENWSPQVTLAKSESQTLLDVFAITDDGIWQSRYYHDTDHTALIFERETLSLPRLSG